MKSRFLYIVMGGIYMAIIVALIVGRYLSPQTDQEPSGTGDD